MGSYIFISLDDGKGLWGYMNTRELILLIVCLVYYLYPQNNLYEELLSTNLKRHQQIKSYKEVQGHKDGKYPSVIFSSLFYMNRATQKKSMIIWTLMNRIGKSSNLSLLIFMYIETERKIKDAAHR